MKLRAQAVWEYCVNICKHCSVFVAAVFAICDSGYAFSLGGMRFFFASGNVYHRGAVPNVSAR